MQAHTSWWAIRCANCSHANLSARWRSLEAMLACCSSNADDVIEYIEKEKAAGRIPAFQPLRLLSDIVPPLLSLRGTTFSCVTPTAILADQPEHPFLQGRSLIFASRFSSLVPNEIARRYAVNACEIIQTNDASISVKLSAIKAIRK